jgi:hypothetical protein
MGQTDVERLLRENMQQEEETAQIAERSAALLLQKAMQAGARARKSRGSSTRPRTSSQASSPGMIYEGRGPSRGSGPS